MAENDVPSDGSSDDLKKKAKKALKSIQNVCSYLQALQPLIKQAPPEILVYVLQQFAKVLPTDPQAKR